MKSMMFVSALALSAGSAMAVITPFADDFSYADGQLTSVSGGNWVNTSGTGNFVQVSSGTISLAHGSGSREDLGRSLGGTVGAGDKVYFGFDVTMNGSADATNTYFAHLRTAGTFFNARIWAAAPNVPGGGFTFGLSDGSTIDTKWASDFAYGTTHRVIGLYDYSAQIIRLWVNASDESDTSLSVGGVFQDPLASFAFRQDAGNTSQIIDNLIVDTNFDAVVPTPGAAVLAGIAGLAGLRRRRA